MSYVGTQPIILNVTPGMNKLTVDFSQNDLGDPAPIYFYSFNGTDVLGSGVFLSPLEITDISATTTFYIVASNSAGDVFSDSSSGTPNFVGSIPTIDTITPGTNQLTVAFSQSNIGSPEPTYYYSLDGTTPLGTGVSSSPLIITDISATTTFYIIASNSVGNVVSDSSSGTPNLMGSNPTIDTITPGTNQLTVAFSQSNIGNPAPTYYYSLDGTTLLGTGVSSSPLIITDISATTTFYIIASNSAGDVVSDSSSGIPNFVGSNPTIDTITPGTNQLTVAFSQSNIGSPAPTYYYSLDGTTPLGTGVSSSPLIITDISATTTFYIVASNSIGNVVSDSSSGIPNFVGSVPVVYMVDTSENQVTVYFDQMNLGSPVPTYYYSLDGTTLLGAGISSSPLIITDISAETSFQIVASNIVGNVFSTSYTGIQDFSGNSPVINTITPGTNQLTVDFTQSRMGKPSPTYYYSLDGTTLLGAGVSSSPLIITDISATTTFYIIASNSAGDVVSDSSSGTPNYLGTNPIINTITPGANQLTVAFSQSNVGSPAAKYYYSLDDGVTISDASFSSSPIVITDISAETTFKIVARNIVGDILSDASAGTPYYVGSVPSIDTITSGINQLTVDFSQNMVGNPAATYYYTLDNGATVSDASFTASPLIITDISASTTFKIVARNLGGDVLSDASSGTPYFSGSAPVIDTITPGTHLLTVAFTQSNTGNPEPTYYYSLDNGATVSDASFSASPLIITDISAATTFQIVARNLVGDVLSDASSGTPDYLGSSLTIDSITPGTNQLTVAFSQSNVGSPAAKYYYTLDDGATVSDASFSASPLIITDISAETTFKLVARNIVGDILSDTSAGTPYYLGSVPTIDVVTPGSNNLTVDFSQNMVGNPAATYYYTLDNGATVSDASFTTSPLIITDISAATTFKVVARNLAGDVLSDSSSGIPDYLGSIPVVYTVDTSENQLTVYFEQMDTGSPAPIYYYSLDGGTTLSDASFSTSPLIIMDVSADVSFNVVASNIMGNVVSLAYDGIQPFLGSSPVITNITPDTNKLTVDFTQNRLGKPSPTYYYTLDDGTTVSDASFSASPLEIVDISAATTFKVVARNDAGDVLSDASSGTPNYLGSSPVINTITPGTNTLTVAFTQSDTGSPAPAYYYTLDDGATVSDASFSASPLVITDISAETTFKVVARNIVGDVLSDASSGTPDYLGSSLIIDSITPGTNQLTIAFTQSNVGNPAPVYYYTLDDGATVSDASFSASPIVITDISAETTFKIVARNLVGDVLSDMSSGTPDYLGSTPSIVSITPGTNTLTVAFTQSDTGSPAPAYYYTLDDGATVSDASFSASPLVITDISAATTFKVVARNILGDILSDASSGIPYYLGSKPTIDVVTPGTNILTVDFSQSNFGNPVPAYYYTLDNGATVSDASFSASPLVITDIISASTFKIVARNLAGDILSDASSGLPRYIGSTPVITNIVAGRNNLTVYFTQSAISNPAPTYRYSLNGSTALGTAVNSSPLVIPTINVPTDFYIVSTNALGSVFSAQATGAPLLFGLNDIAGNSLNVTFQINNASTWVTTHSYGSSQIIYLQGLVNASSPTGYEYITAYVKHSGELVVESYTNDVSGVGYKTFAVSFEDRTNNRLPPETLYICNLNINEDRTVTVGFYYYLATTGLWVFSGSLTTDSVSTSYSDWSIIEVGRGRTSYSSGNIMHSQLRINNVEIFPIAGPWFALYKSYLLATTGSVSGQGTGRLTSPYYTFNYDRVSGNLPVRTYLNGNLTSGILAMSNAKYIELNPGDGYSGGYAYNYLTVIEYFISAPNTNPPKIPCFGENTRILCFNPDTFEEEYVAIQKIRRGTLVKTLRNGYVPVDMIGRTTIRNDYGTSQQEERHKNRLYKCTRRNYPEMTEDELILTGCHCILVDDFKNEAEREKTIEVNRKIYITDGKYRLPACVDDRAIPYEKTGTFPIYHLALENDDYYMNYGVYANGLLVETSSRRYLKELSNMVLL